MRLPAIKKLLLEDFPTEQEWIAKLIIPLNEFMTNVINLVNGNILLTDNGVAQIKQLTISGASTIMGDVLYNTPVIFNPSSLEGISERMPVRSPHFNPNTVVLRVFSNEFIDVADTSGSGGQVISGITSTANYMVGQPISGPGIPANSYIISIPNTTSVRINNTLIGGGGATVNIRLHRGILVSSSAYTTSLGTAVSIGGSFPIAFQKTIPGKPVSVHIGYIAENVASPQIITTPVTLDWSYSDTQIIINNIAGLNASKQYNVTLFVLGG